MATIFGLGTMVCGLANAHTVTLPDATYDEPVQKTSSQESIVVSGGCFWGVQDVFQHVKGVSKAVSGYAGGNSMTAHYEIVSTGQTGHAESVQVTYDPSQVTLGQLMKVFFAVAHDPTELNRQGPDQGTQYRSAIFTSTAEQKKIVDSYISQLDQAKVFSDPIATKVSALDKFYPAEDYHQDYAKLHPMNPYIAMNDLPKVAALQKQFPDLYVK